MANLVSPGYSESALINQVLEPYAARTIEFKGLNRRSYREDGEMSWMRELDTHAYPFLAPRKPMDFVSLGTAGYATDMITRFGHRLMIANYRSQSVDHFAFYVDDHEETSVYGLSEDTYMVAINTKVCFFPEKLYVEFSPDGTVGTFDSLDVNTSTSANATLSIDAAEHTDGYATLDWGFFPFQADDAVNISGTVTVTNSTQSETKTINVNTSAVIASYESGSMKFPSEVFLDVINEVLDDQDFDEEDLRMRTTFSGSVSRTVPDLDYVIEWNNRLWGACNADNTIYASKLGDPTNWQYFQGTSIDSYYAQQGTNGVFTGIAPYSNHLIFFKQDSITRIFGSSPSSFQLSNMMSFGVKEGYAKSIAVINDCVIYYSVRGFMAYQGGVPYPIGEKLCLEDRENVQVLDIRGDTDGTKYYAFVREDGSDSDPDSGTAILTYCLDLEKALWHIYNLEAPYDEVTATYHQDGKLFVCFGRSALDVIDPMYKADLTEYNFPWYADFGPFTEYIENERIYSKIGIRVKAWEGAHVQVFISEDEGAWEKVAEFNPATTGGEYIMIIPRRCDRYGIRIEGSGKAEIQSLTRFIRTASKV